MMHANSASSNAEWGAVFASPSLGRAGGNMFLNLNPEKFHRPSRAVVQDVPMEIEDDAGSPSVSQPCHFPPAPQRASIKKQSRCAGQARKVGFHNSVDVRLSLADPGRPENVWFTADELRSMRQKAFNPHSPLRHSDQIDRNGARQIQQELLSSPPPPEEDGEASGSSISSAMLPRVTSASAQLGAVRSNAAPPRDRVATELDREVYITNEERRRSTRRRLIHYTRVFNEIDRQCDAGYTAINVAELACASRMATGNALVRALEKGRKEASLAQAAQMSGRRRLL